MEGMLALAESEQIKVDYFSFSEPLKGIYLISDDALLDAFRDGIDGISSLAEHFMVTPEIVTLRLKLFEKPVY